MVGAGEVGGPQDVPACREQGRLLHCAPTAVSSQRGARQPECHWGNAWEVSVLGSADLLCLHLGGPSGGADTAQVWEPSILNAPSGGLSLF